MSGGASFTIRYLPLAVLTAGCLLGSTAYARQPPLPAGWRVPGESLLAGPDRALREKEPHRYLEATGDFDGDGRTDIARLLVDEPGARHALFITTSRRGRLRHDRIQDGPAALLGRTGVAAVSAGVYATACGKGLGRGPCPARSVRLRNAGVSYFTFEAGAIYAWWNGERWVTTPISD